MEEPTDLGSVDIDFSFDVDDEVTVPVSSPSPIRNDSSAITPKKPPSTKVQSKPPRDFQDEVSTDFQIDSSAKQDNDEDLDDEFDVWDGEAPKQQKHSPSPPRRVLKASKQQQQFESKKAAVLEAQNLEKKQKEAEISEEVSSDTLMHTTSLDKAGLDATNVLSQYQEPTDSQELRSKNDVEDEARFAQAAEFDEVQIRREEEHLEEAVQTIGIKPKTKRSVISYDEFLNSSAPEALAAHESDIQRFDFRALPLWRRILIRFCGPPSLASTELTEERDTVLALAHVKLDHGNENHERALGTLYMRLTGDNHMCPTIGTHWDTIGFQGNDPGTDLRGSGIFGLIQILYLIKHHSFLAEKIFRLSRNDLQNFPFAVVSLNITGLVLTVLRQTSLYKLSNRDGSVYTTVNDLYCALFYNFYLVWKNECKTIINFSDVKAQLAEMSRTNARILISNFKEKQKINVGENDEDFTKFP
eukprot:18299_1